MLSGVSVRSIYRLLEAKAFKARRSVSGARTLIDYASLKAYFTSLPEYISGASMPNAPHVTGKRKRKAVLQLAPRSRHQPPEDGG